MLLADGFEDAFIGVGFQFNKNLAIYDRKKCIQILMERDKMSLDEAEEFFEFNVQGSYVGELTPVFVDSMTLCEVEEIMSEREEGVECDIE
jgi:hypothetical protein